MALDLFEIQKQKRWTFLNIANWQLEKSNEHKETEKKADIFFQKSSTFEFQRKINGLKAV